MTRTVLVTGATGLAGPWIARGSTALGAVVTTSRSGGDRPCDLRDRPAARALISDVRPDIVIHTAALTDVDRCEREPTLADELNRRAVEHLRAALPPATLLIVLSTDQAYPDRSGPHPEGDESPVNVYGRTKLDGELEALQHERTLVVRTNFFGPSLVCGRESLSDFVIRRMRTGAPTTLFTDVQFSPVHLASLVETVCDLVEVDARGVLNLGSREGGSKLEFGLAVAARLSLPTDTVTPGRAADIAARAPRPSDLRLDVSRVEGTLGRRMPTLREEIERL